MMFPSQLISAPFLGLGPLVGPRQDILIPSFRTSAAVERLPWTATNPGSCRYRDEWGDALDN